MKRFKKLTVSLRQSVYPMAAACILSVTGLGLISPSVSYAKEVERVFSAEIGALVNISLRFGNESEYHAALHLLFPLTERTDLNPYERATIYQMIGQYQYELGRPILAQEAFDNARRSGGLLPKEDKSLQIVIAQLMIGNGQYQEGAERLSEYLEAYVKENDIPNLQYIELMLDAMVQAEGYEQALPWAEMWLEMSDKKHRGHYELLTFLYNHLDMPERQLDLLAQMIKQWPEDETLLRALMSKLTRLGREDDAFEVAKLLYLRGGMTDETELVKLVQYYAFYDMPFQAAEILEKEMAAKRIPQSTEHMKRLGELFIQARERERALPIFEAIVEDSDDVEFLTKLGHNYVEAKACQKAEAVLEKAVANGYDAGKGQLRIGMCYYDEAADMDPLACSLSDAERRDAPKSVSRDAAIAAFKAVPEGSREKRNAKKWVQFIEAEISAIDRRCDSRIHDGPEGLCYQKIKQAYDAAIFTGGFKVEDDSCRKYIPDYDANFRVQTPTSKN